MTAAPPSDDQDLLAAEYVLGTLDPDERAQARALASVDSGFAASVRAWELRFGDLCLMVEPVDPPEPAWEAIKAKITASEPATPMELPAVEATAPAEPAAEPEPDVAAAAAEGPRRAGPWRGIAIVACLIAIILSADVLTGLYAPELLPKVLRPRQLATAPADSAPPAEPQPAEAKSDQAKSDEAKSDEAKSAETQPAETKPAATEAAETKVDGTAGTEVTPVTPPVTGSAAPQPPAAEPASTARTPATGRFAAVLQKEPGNAGFVLTLDPARSRLTVRRIGAAADAGKSYQLWILSDRFPGPRSLGMLKADDFTVVEGLSAYDRETIDGATFAVSLEPDGGSATGVASEPFVFKGKLVAMTPEPEPMPAPAPDNAAAPAAEKSDSKTAN